VSTDAEPIAASSHGINPWCTEEDLPASRLSRVKDVDRGLAIAAATDLLYVLSGRQYRTGRSQVRPTTLSGGYQNQSYLYPYSSMSGYGDAWGFAAGWAWSALGAGWQSGQDQSELVLQGPVTRIHAVMVNGVNLGGWNVGNEAPNPNYTLYERRRLVLSIGPQSTSNAFPWNQQIQMPLSEPGTFGVDYEWGKPPTDIAHLACIELAVEFALTLSGQNPSKLPARVLSVATQGVTLAVGDPMTYILQDLTGLPICDMFLRGANPHKLRRRSAFLGPNSIMGREAPAGGFG
jgi:hypothetical protein